MGRKVSPEIESYFVSMHMPKYLDQVYENFLTWMKAEGDFDFNKRSFRSRLSDFLRQYYSDQVNFLASKAYEWRKSLLEYAEYNFFRRGDFEKIMSERDNILSELKRKIDREKEMMEINAWRLYMSEEVREEKKQNLHQN